MKATNFSEQQISSQTNFSNLSEEEKSIIELLQVKKQCTQPEVVDQLCIDNAQAQKSLEELTKRNLLKVIPSEKHNIYIIKTAQPKKYRPVDNFLKYIEQKIGRIKLSTLIMLIFVTAFLLTPFVFSSLYLPILREYNFKLHQILQGNSYKLTTGYIALLFAFLEMILTLRKRARGWWLKITIPGSLLLWRSLHIFIGVAFLGIILVHTAGSKGLNFNAVFLWVFFGVTLSALVGSVAEMGVLESPQKSFGAGAVKNNVLTKFLPSISKAKLIRTLRDLWLSSHIFLVNVFFVMLAFHIFLAYYYQ